MTWPILPPTLQPKLDTFFWYSSARIWSIFKMDTRMDGSVLAVLAAYQNNLVTSKMMTSQVAEWFPTSTSGKYNSWRKRVKVNLALITRLSGPEKLSGLSRNRPQEPSNPERATPVLYSAANDPETANDPRPEMIPKLDRKWSPTANDPQTGPQMIPVKKLGMASGF